MEIHASTQFTYKKYRQFQLFCKFRGKYYKLWLIALYSCPVLSAILFILYCWMLYMNPTELKFLYIHQYLLSYFLLLIYQYFSPSKSVYETQEKMLAIPNDYTFYEDEFSVMAVNAQYSETTIIKYSFLDRVYEADKTFYLYLTKKTVFPIWKDGINPQEIDELRARLLSHLETDKYIKCK